MRNIQSKFVLKTKTNILCSKISFLRKLCLLSDNVEKRGGARDPTDHSIIRRRESARIQTYTQNILSSVTNKMQRYTIYLFLWNALHVSGGSSAHHQELKTVYTASGTSSNLYCYLPLSWKRWNCHCRGSSSSSATVAGSSNGLTKYPMLYIQFELLMMGGGTAWNM
jgi:hypothetical protein